MRFDLPALLVLGFASAPALASSVSPSPFVTTLDKGESVTVTKTVTIEAGPVTNALVDIFFLSDTTGSMGGFINTVRNNASSILAGTAGFGDVAWGVGEYKDFPRSPWGGSSDFPWRLNTAITSNQASVTAGLGQWGASGGNDIPESNLYALQQAATASDVGWREGSARFIVWFGDARGHDPSTTTGYPGPTLAGTIESLTNLNATVFAFGTSGLDSTGQATAITGATGGQLFLGGNPGAAIVDQIRTAIEASFETYSTVALVPVGNMPGVKVITSPAYTGSFDRSVTRTFDFEVTYTGLLPGTHDFTMRGLVDGATVASSLERIIVRSPAGVIPEPATWAMLIAGFGLVGGIARRRKVVAGA